MCDLDVYNYLYENDLEEYQTVSKKSLHISDFIMVPPSINNQVSIESRSPQPELYTFDSATPRHEDVPSKDNLHPSTKTDNAIPSQGSSPHIDSALGRSNILTSEKMPKAPL
jgi:hypothetical protein